MRISAIILYVSAAGNTSRTRRSTSPAAQSTEVKALAKFQFRNWNQENVGLLHTVRHGRDSRRQEQRVHNPGLLQVANF